ncbi:hypothetical protein KCU93_g9068, partial [Aureobasidium melanogenum]
MASTDDRTPRPTQNPKIFYTAKTLYTILYNALLHEEKDVEALEEKYINVSDDGDEDIEIAPEDVPRIQALAKTYDKGQPVQSTKLLQTYDEAYRKKQQSVTPLQYALIASNVKPGASRSHKITAPENFLDIAMSDA